MRTTVEPMTPAGRGRRTAPRSRRRKRIALLVLLAVVVAGLLAGGIALRSLQVSGDLSAARTAALRALATAQRAGLTLTARDAASIATDLGSADAALTRAADALDHDPLLRIGRALPVLGTQLDAVATITAAARELAGRGPDVRILLTGFAAARDAGQGTARIAALVRFFRAERGRLDDLIGAFDRADALAAGLPGRDLWGPVAGARDLLVAKLADARPLVAAARAAPAVAAALGAGGEKRYLLLALDPAEIRPIGGLIAAFATPRFTDGLLHDYGFKDIASIDRATQPQYVAPPPALAAHLLGPRPWQVADAGWWPDFARSADEARRLYRIETGDGNLQGTIAFTPEFVDALLRLVGPVPIPAAGITVHAGETYLASLEQVEVLRRGEGRKQFLADLASTVLDRVFALPLTSYPALWAAIDDAGKRRHLQVHLDDAAAQRLVTQLGWYSPFSFPASGDRLAIMESNTAPVSKLDVLLDLRHDLTVALQPDGSARERLVTTFTNRYGRQLPPALARVRSSFFTGNLGSYQRRYLRPDAKVLSVSSDNPKVRITDPDSVDLESGCLAVANYQLVAPGSVRLETVYAVPGVVTASEGRPATGGTYSLHFFKQPGRDGDALTVRVTVPGGTIPIQWSSGGVRTGSTVVFTASTAFDRTFTVTYRSP